MTPCKDLCEDHEQSLICQVKLKKDIEAMKAERVALLTEKRKEAKLLWTMVRNKLDASTFNRTMTACMIIMMCVLSVWWTKLNNISNNVHEMALTQREVVTTLKEIKSHADLKIRELSKNKRSWKSER